MSRAEVSERQAGSIDAVVARLVRWGRIAPSGLARVEYISDLSQLAALQRLRDGFQQLAIPFTEIALPARKPAVEQIRFLMERLSQIESGVVSITGFTQAFSEDVPLLESLRILNFNRENLTDFPLRQIWWMPRNFTQTFRQSIPDLNSWFILKLRLDEITSPSHVARRIERDTPTYVMSYEEGVKASNLYATRFRTALQRQTDPATLWRIWLEAVSPVVETGRTNEAILLQEALLQEALEQGVEMGAYLASECSDPALLNRVALIYHNEQQTAEAEPLFQKALTIRRAALPAGHPDIATSLNNLALLYYSQGRYAEAEPLLQEALTIRRAALPAGHPDIATSLNNLTLLFKTQGSYAEAESLYQEALTIQQAALPAGHPDIANSLNNLAGLYCTQGRYAEAEPLYQEALAIRRKALPAGNPSIANSLNNLAALYYAQGRNAEAEPIYQEAVNILRKCYGDEHPNTKIVTAKLSSLREKIQEQEQERS
jgi:tetratricopeptide (TPR) repeat protein